MKTRAQMIEEAARACMAGFHNGHDYCHGEPWPQNDRIGKKWEDAAKAVIAIVAEEAAKVCEEAADAAYESWRMCADPADQGAEIQANKLAAAIRERFKQQQG